MQMNGSTYLILLAVFLLVIIPWITRRRRLAAVRHILNQKKQNKENREMKELAKRLCTKGGGGSDTSSQSTDEIYGDTKGRTEGLDEEHNDLLAARANV